MIRPEDFEIEIRHHGSGTFVRVTHTPTGNKRTAEGGADDVVGATRDALISQLRTLLYRPEEIRCDTGRSEGGDFIRVVHLPSGIERMAMRRESTHDQLLDAVLEELFARDGAV